MLRRSNSVRSDRLQNRISPIDVERHYCPHEQSIIFIKKDPGFSGEYVYKLNSLIVYPRLIPVRFSRAK